MQNGCLTCRFRRKPYPRWNAVEKALVTALEPFGADTAARDASRCLRHVGTVNPRSGERCQTIWQDERGGGINRWDFDTLSRELLPLSREEIAQGREAGQAKQKQRKEREAHAEPRICLNLWTGQQLWWNRLTDIRRLIALRGWQQTGVPVGCRNNFLFVAACAVAWSIEPSRFDLEVAMLAKEFTPSLLCSEVRASTGNVLRRVSEQGRYRMKSEKIIELLDIQPDEQQRLHTLVNDELRTERKQEKDRQYHRKGSDRHSYEKQAQERRETARSLRAAGQSYKQIAVALGVTVKAIENYLRY